ncbi:polysaccharide deacetylase family protein [Geotalea sp. SG265]|uniref:polysaccharide deacetylase family protein n=1 Tax=Geotalea sp. SG265 TaxID=2922867 RepID=UPI001FAF589E|nr:polysaccharide deacetylase family protein [Geotalea sp. SG265]
MRPMQLLDRRYLSNAWKGIRSIILPRFKVLAYHSVNVRSGDPYEVTVADFAAQMQFLADRNYGVISLRGALESLKNGNVGEKNIVITFDDGFKSLTNNAFPVLKEYGFPATVFLPVKYVGGIDEFSYSQPRPTMPIMGWREIERSLEQGIDYGSHSMTHPNLLNMSDRQLDYELGKSKSILERRLGLTFFPFAYPFGLFDQTIKENVKKAGYHCALCFGNVLSNSAVTDHFEMKREKILHGTTLKEFARMVDTRNDFIRKVKRMFFKQE